MYCKEYQYLNLVDISIFSKMKYFQSFKIFNSKYVFASRVSKQNLDSPWPKFEITVYGFYVSIYYSEGAPAIK